MIVGIQIIGMIFCIIMLYFTYVYYKRNNYGLRSFILWLIVWLVALFVVLFPKTLYGVMDALQIQRTADFITLVGFAFFAVISFYLYIVVKKNNRKMEQLVQEFAIRNAINKPQEKTKKNSLKK